MLATKALKTRNGASSKINIPSSNTLEIFALRMATCAV
jgi:hypothetical protein